MKTKDYILIVDDDADDREILKDAFINTTQGKEFVFIDNGEKLLSFLDENGANGLPSLILLDLNMPGKDGRETLREIKANKELAHIPIIIFTTSSSSRDKLTCYTLGANCFLTKPDTFNKLVELTGSISKLWLH